MEVQGIEQAFLDIPPEYTDAFSRWYDLDHMPELVSVADALSGRRYVAPGDLRRLPETLSGEITGGYRPYITQYCFGAENFTGEAARARWDAKARMTVQNGRMWRKGSPPLAAHWRLRETFRRASLLISDEAVPHVPHRGMIVAIGKAKTPEHQDAALDWWRQVHLVDLLTVEGVLAALRFDGDDERSAGLILHQILLEDDPGAVWPRGSAIGWHTATPWGATTLSERSTSRWCSCPTARSCRWRTTSNGPEGAAGALSAARRGPSAAASLSAPGRAGRMRDVTSGTIDSGSISSSAAAGRRWQRQGVRGA